MSNAWLSLIKGHAHQTFIIIRFLRINSFEHNKIQRNLLKTQIKPTLAISEARGT